jgi:serine/threonine-protein kinase
VPQYPSCGKQLDADARFCPDDGTPVTPTSAGNGAPTASPSAPAKLILPAILCGRYRLESLLGGGGMAKVYRAVDQTLEREIAVKVMNAELRQDPDFDARFQREARIASQLNCPYIVVVHDFGLDADQGPYLVMEYLRGQTLRDRMRTAGPLPVPTALQVAAQVLLALIHAHEKGIVHRDIKPDNVFILNQSGVGMQIRVLDFGIARMVHSSHVDRAATLTHPGAILGTPRYMSPEQLAGQQIDARSDLYSAALVVFETLTGTLPFSCEKKLIELCPEIPPAIQDLLNSCLQPNLADRPPSVVHAYRRLREICSARGITLYGPDAAEPLPERPGSEAPTIILPSRRAKLRRRLLLGIGAAALLGLALAGVAKLILSSSTGGASSGETLLGLAIGDSRDDVVAKFGKPDRHFSGDPWKDKGDFLGFVLQPEDLAGAAGWEGFETLTWHHDELCVVFRDNVVTALVVHQVARAHNGRGLRLGDTETKIENLYNPEKPAIDTADSPAASRRILGKSANWIKIYRYNKLGMGFEIRDEKVVSMTLFPPQPE